MLLRVSLLTLAVSGAAHAGAVNVISKDNRFFLEAKKCEQLQAEISAIAQWTKLLGETRQPLVVDCTNAPTRRVEITSILPSYFKAFSGKRALCYGPNCFSFALIGHRIHHRPRAVGETEMTLSLELFCRELSRKAETPLPGDVGLIRDRHGANFNEVHAFNFIGETVASKNGESITATLQLQDKDDMFDFYHVDRDCRNFQEERSCDRFVTYFRCDPSLVKRDEIAAFDEIEHRLAQSLYEKDKIGELSALEDLFEIMQTRLEERQSDIVKAKLASIEYQLKRMQPEEEEFLLEVIRKKERENYPKVSAYLRKAVRNKAAGKSLPFGARSLVKAIVEQNNADFNDDLREALPALSPTLRKKAEQYLEKAK